MKIAVILTCFNRKQKTLSCLKSLFEARDNYEPKLELYVYLTDDGCTDGTAEAVRESFPKENITILQGDGNLFWAGGMRFAWNEALKNKDEWDFYLLLNDDTTVFTNVWEELLGAHNFALKKFHKAGLYSGITCKSEGCNETTYGGDVITSKIRRTYRRLTPIGRPQECDKANGNILLVDKSVVNKMGIFYKEYRHSIADNDYSYQAKKKGFPVLVTSHFCGICENDHESYSEYAERIITMNLKQRKKFYASPLHSTKDILISCRRNAPYRLPFVLLGRFLNIYFPKIYFRKF